MAAPGKIERPATDRVKTDRRDAERLVRLLMIGGLHPVRPAEEVPRDLLLLRHDLRFAGNNWTERHREWLARIELPEPVAQAVLLDGIGSIDALLVRRDDLEARMITSIPGSP